MFIDPKVELIDKCDGRLEAWKISRPYLEDAKLEDITSMDLMVNAIAGYILHIRSSILMRDLLFTLRPAPAWAQSNRVIPFTEQTVNFSSEYRHFNDDYLEQAKEYILEQINYKPQDEVKKHLPMAFSTEYTIFLDDRTLVTFLYSLRFHNLELYEAYAPLFLEAIGQDESYILNRRTKDLWPHYALTNEEYRAELGTKSYLDSVVIVTEVSANLMAQVIRTSNNKYHNELFNLVNNSTLSQLTSLKCSDPLRVVIYSNEPTWSKVRGVRSCWCAQWDQPDNSSWEHIIGHDVADLTPAEFLACLPCRGNHNNCSLYEDLLGRRDCVDHNIYCPILAEMPSLVDKRKQKYNSQGTLIEHWEQLVAEGMIKDNPDNEDRKIYEQAIQTKRSEPEWSVFFED